MFFDRAILLEEGDFVWGILAGDIVGGGVVLGGYVLEWFPRPVFS